MPWATEGEKPFFFEFRTIKLLKVEKAAQDQWLGETGPSLHYGAECDYPKI